MKTLVDGVKKFQSEVFAAKKDLFQRWPWARTLVRSLSPVRIHGSIPAY